MNDTEKVKITVHIDEDLEDLIPGFLQNRHTDIKAMRDSLEKDDFESIRIMGHSMKGAGGGYGFDKITDIGSDIETAANNKNKTIINKNIDELEDYIDRVDLIFIEME